MKATCSYGLKHLVVIFCALFYRDMTLEVQLLLLRQPLVTLFSSVGGLIVDALKLSEDDVTWYLSQLGISFHNERELPSLKAGVGLFFHSNVSPLIFVYRGHLLHSESYA